MDAYLPLSELVDDYDYIRRNGMWYQHWQSGYGDILKRGYPRPKFKTTILAELYSPNVCDFLHGGTDDVPFLISEDVRKILRQHGLTGFRFSRVEVARIATKGIRNKPQLRGEPGDSILKAGCKSRPDLTPKLHAVRVTGRLDIIPDHPSGRCPYTDYVTPFRLPRQMDSIPDLWRPTIKGRTFAAWTYCSGRFKMIVEKHRCSNIRFQSFRDMMAQFRRAIDDEKKQLTTRSD